jgi:hypothetical protein
MADVVPSLEAILASDPATDFSLCALSHADQSVDKLCCQVDAACCARQRLNSRLCGMTAMMIVKRQRPGREAQKRVT